MAGVTVEQIVEVQLHLIDKMTGPMDAVATRIDKTTVGVKDMEKAVDKGIPGIESAFSRLDGIFQSLLPVASALGGALGFAKVLENTEQYIKKIKSVHELTGASVSETDQLFSSARRAGVEYGTMERIMFSLSKRGAVMGGQLAAMSGQQLPGMVKTMQRLGVDVSKGPVAALRQMSEQVQAGRLGADELMQAFQIPPGAVNDFKGFLESIDEAQVGELLSDADVEAVGRMEAAQNRMADAWNRIQLMVSRHLLPVIAELLEGVAERIEKDWLPAARHFGSFLADNMDRVVGAAKAFVAVMTARKMLKLAEDLASPSGWLGKLASGGLGAMKGGVGGMLGGLGSSLGGITSAFVAAAPALLAIGAAVGVIVLGFRAVEANVGGVKDRLVALWDSIRARVESIGASMEGLWQKVAGVFGETGPFTEFIGKVAALSFEKVVQGVDLFIHTVQTAISFLGELGEQIVMVWKDYLAKPWREYVVDPFLQSMKWLGDGVAKLFNLFVDGYNKIVSKLGGTAIGFAAKGFEFDAGWLKEPVDMWEKHWLKTQADTDKRAARIRLDRELKEANLRREAPDKKPPQPYYDFRGSRFDITQQFAEGFDPDRIAVAFASDLASLGELRAQSGFAPIFGTR